MPGVYLRRLTLYQGTLIFLALFSIPLRINYNICHLIYDSILLSLIFYRRLYKLMISSHADVFNLLFYNRMKFVGNSVTSGFSWSRGQTRTMTNNELRLLIRHSKLAQTESGIRKSSPKRVSICSDIHVIKWRALSIVVYTHSHTHTHALVHAS